MLQALKEDEELKRAAAEDEYRQRKTVVTELRQDLENRRNEKELQMAKLSLQREALVSLICYHYYYYRDFCYCYSYFVEMTTLKHCVVSYQRVAD